MERHDSGCTIHTILLTEKNSVLYSLAYVKSDCNNVYQASKNISKKIELRDQPKDTIRKRTIVLQKLLLKILSVWLVYSELDCNRIVKFDEIQDNSYWILPNNLNELDG